MASSPVLLGPWAPTLPLKADDEAFFWTQDGRGCLVESGPVSQIFEAPRHPLTAAYVRGLKG